MSRIPLLYTPPDRHRLDGVLKRYEGMPHTSMLQDFERTLSDITGAKYVLALNSGTAAIHLGLVTLGIRPGDEVLVSTFTYVASVNPVLYLGARPVFIDSEADTWNMDPSLLEQAIRQRLNAGIKPKAIIVVHAYGMPAKIHELRSVADRYEIPVLEDAAEALGSRYHGRHAGTLAKVGILSFNNNKIVTTYGGGALLTDDKSIYDQALFLSEQAREEEPYYKYETIGYNYRMGSVNAASGLAWINDLDTILTNHRRIRALYEKELAPRGGMFLKEISGHESNHWLTTLVLNSDRSIQTIIGALKNDGIEGRFLWNPMHKQPVFKDFQYFGGDFAEKLFKTGLCLPSGNHLQPSDQARIIQKMKYLLE